MFAAASATLGTPCRSKPYVRIQTRLVLAVGVSAVAFSGAAAEPHKQVVEINPDANFYSQVQHHISAEDSYDVTSHSDMARWDRGTEENVVSSEIEDGGGKKIIRSEEVSALEFAASPTPSVSELLSAPAGVVQGACANFRRTGDQDVSVSCPKPLKMVGCSCRDKVGQNNGACGTKFSALETCSAFTKIERSITAYVRCCHMDWASNFSIHTSKVSESGDGKGVEQACPATHTLLGCACIPGDAPNNGCKHNQVQEKTCLATNMADHPKGVKAQALCAIIPASKNFESRASPAIVIDRSTNLSCSADHLHMISCSCGSDKGQCNGGKVLGNHCECFGKRCFATARCADIPIPATNCHWNFWGEWSGCSKPCGNGTQSRVREIAMLAMNGGTACNGTTNETANCSGDLSLEECNATNITTTIAIEGGHTVLIIVLVFGCLLAVGGGIGGKMYQDHNSHHDDDGDEWHGEGHGEFAGGEYGDGYGEYPGGYGGEEGPPAAFFGGGGEGGDSWG